MILKFFYLACILLILLPMPASAQSSNALPIATTVLIAGVVQDAGEVIVHNDSSDRYMVSDRKDQEEVYGVSAFRPALVFATASGTIPVVTSGVTLLQVSSANGPISRGDLLITSPERGVAMKADIAHNHVFAIALESFEGNSTGTIQAEIGAERAQALLTMLRESEAEAAGAATEEDKPFEVPYARAILASVIAVGALFFILYSFRSSIAKGIVSVGRNPRARGSIVTLAFTNIVFALILCAVVLFVAVGILILPI